MKEYVLVVLGFFLGFVVYHIINTIIQTERKYQRTMKKWDEKNKDWENGL